MLRRNKNRHFTNKLLKLAVGTTPAQLKRGVSDRQLIAAESKIGSQLFGPLQKGGKREFFCLDEHTWIWYESWTDPTTGRKQECTTRYEVHPHCVLKIQDGQPYKEVTGMELYNLAVATRQYLLRVSNEVYSQPLAHAA